MLNLKRLQYLDAVYQYKNFTQASEALYVSQPAISLSLIHILGHLRPTALLRRPSVLPRQNLGEGRIHSARSKRKSGLPQKRQLLWDDDGEGPPPGNFSA